MTGLPMKGIAQLPNDTREAENKSIGLRLTASVVIPCGRRARDVVKIAKQLTTSNTKCLPLEIIVVVDGMNRKDNSDIDDLRQLQLVQVVFTESTVGAAAARNMGIQIAGGDVVLFLDDDCEPTENWLHSHLIKYTCDEIVGVAGPVVFTNSLATDRKNPLDDCCLLYAFDSPNHYEELFWAPTANLSVRNCVAKRCLFSTEFPKDGGGEDVFFGFNVREFGKIATSRDAVVYHPYWTRKFDIARRFCRWGRADAILTALCLNHENLHEYIVPREITPITWFFLSSFFSSNLFFITGNPWIFLVPFMGLFCWVICELLFWHPGRNPVNTVVEIVAVIFFDTASTLIRFKPRFFSVMFKRVLFFPDQLVWLWTASSRVQSSTLIGYCIGLLLSIVLGYRK